MNEERNDLLEHAVKAIKYRFEKATIGSLENFGEFKISNHSRSPSEILNHMFDLSTKTLAIINKQSFNPEPPKQLAFKEEHQRLLLSLGNLQDSIQITHIEMEVCKRLIQGPLLDITTHIGQIAFLNGLNQNKIPKENYYAVDL
jgi:hypothetical protein